MASLHPARPMDLGAVTSLLKQSKLPTEGLSDHTGTVWVLRENGRVVGAIGYERYGDAALLRSLVVDDRLRGKGHGRTLLEAGVAHMRAAGIQDAYGLTTTIPDLLGKLGWRELPQSELPAALKASAELGGACPDTARAFHLKLGGA